MIIPIAFCKNPTRSSLGKGLFHTQRFDATGAPIATFVLNREPYAYASDIDRYERTGQCATPWLYACLDNATP